MSGSVDERIWLTPAAHASLVAELEQLSLQSSPSPEVETRIAELKQTLRRAELGDKPDDGLVEPGMAITVRFEGDDQPTTFLLAERGIAAADPAIGTDVYSPTSPLGLAITGKFPGDVFRYSTPSGVEVSGTVLAAEPFRTA